MTREEAISIIKIIVHMLEEKYDTDRVEEAVDMAIEALQQEPCDKCVYSTSDGCQYDDITETIPPFESSDDAIRRQAVLKIIDGWYEQNRDTDNIEDLIVLITYMDSVNPQKPKSECEHDHEILKAYSDGASAVLDNVRAEIEERKLNSGGEPNRELAFNVCLQIIDGYMTEEDKA